MQKSGQRVEQTIRRAPIPEGECARHTVRLLPETLYSWVAAASAACRGLDLRTMRHGPFLTSPGGIVKRSSAMVLGRYCEAIAKTCGLDDATHDAVCGVSVPKRRWAGHTLPAVLRPLFSVLWLGVILTAGCRVGPNFEPPQTQVPDQWVGPTPPTPAAGTQDLAQWWTLFEDPMLTSLIERAAESNLDLKLAAVRIRQARASRGIAASGLGPTLDATGAFRRGQSGGEAGPTTSLYQTGLDAGWELDIFGGARRSVEAAEADLQAAVEARRNVLVTLMAEVALNYTDLRSFQEQIAIAQRNLKAQQHSADLTRQRFEGGFVSGLDVANADAQVATTAGQIPLLEQSARQTIYNLSVLIGREPGALVQELSPAAAIPGAPPAAPVGVPSELLRRRPDIRLAEAQIHGATARIGVATADLFPRISLSGTVGTQGDKFSSLTDWSNRFWSVGPSASWTLFATGRIRSNIELQRAFEEESVIAYRQTVLAALQEVENALIASAKEQEHRQAVIDAVAANRKAVQLATELYTQGQTDFLNVLQAQGALYSSENALAQSTRTVSTNLIALYKALGGGWTSTTSVEPQTQHR